MPKANLHLRPRRLPECRKLSGRAGIRLWQRSPFSKGRRLPTGLPTRRSTTRLVEVVDDSSRRRGIPNLLANLFLPFIDFIYPPVCISCEGRLSDSQRHVCTSCWDSLERVTAADELAKLQQRRFDAEGVVAKFLSCYYFDEEGAIQQIIHGLKYENRRSLGIELGRILGDCVRSNPEFQSAALVIPVPLHRVKFRERGYNQSDFICKGLSEVTGQAVRTDILLRVKNTASQTKLSLEDRTANVDDAFAVVNGCEEEVRGARVILIDDVITTGATLSACGKALRDAGVAEVFAASVALAK